MTVLTRTKHRIPRAYNTEPLHWLRRLIDKSSIDPEAKAHASLWFRKIYARCDKDLALQAITKSAVVAYLHTVKLEHELISKQHDTAETERLSRLLILWSAQLARMLRLSGLWKTAPKGKQGKTLFSPTADERRGARQGFDTGRQRPDRGDRLDRDLKVGTPVAPEVIGAEPDGELEPELDAAIA